MGNIKGEMYTRNIEIKCFVNSEFSVIFYLDKNSAPIQIL